MSAWSVFAQLRHILVAAPSWPAPRLGTMTAIDERTMSACARNIVNCANVAAGEAVIVKGGVHAMRMLEKIAVECYRRKAIPLITVTSDRYTKEVYKVASASVLSDPPKHFESAVKSMDTLIALEELDDPAIAANFPPKKVQARRSGMMPIVDIIHHPTDGKKWVYAGWPTRAAAKAYGVPYSDLQRLVIGGTAVASQQLMRVGKSLERKFKDAMWVRVSDDNGTDFRVKVLGRRANIDDGVISKEDFEANDRGANLPAGELFFAPHETVGEGSFFCPITRDEMTEKLVRDLHLEFKGGRLLLDKVSASRNGDAVVASFKAYQQLDKKKYNPVRTTNIAELGIGFNPRIDKAIGYILTDEKVKGTVHIAFGMNKSYGGTSASIMHWDFVSAPGVDIEVERVDGQTVEVMRKGRIV